MKAIEVGARANTIPPGNALPLSQSKRSNRHMRYALTGAALALAALLATIGPPRLIGYGCAGRPLGVALAREESNFLQPCKHIDRLPWITTE